LKAYNDEMSDNSEIMHRDRRIMKTYTGLKRDDGSLMEFYSNIMAGYTEIMSPYSDKMECDNRLL
jgi:hypothetical protein